MPDDYIPNAVNEGKRQAYWHIIEECLAGLGMVLDPADIQMRELYYLRERGETYAALRALCARYGDNEWDYSTYVPDILTHHLGRLPEEQ